MIPGFAGVLRVFAGSCRRDACLNGLAAARKGPARACERLYGFVKDSLSGNIRKKVLIDW